MAKPEAILLGVDLQAGEARVAEVSLKGGKPTVVKIGTIALPPETFQAGLIVAPVPVGQALKGLLDSMEVRPGAPAVVGIPSEANILAAMTVPPVPDGELAAMVAGEIRHYGFLRTAGAQHNFIPLAPLGASASVAEGRQIAVLGAEEAAISGVRAAIEAAGLVVAGIEPSAFAAFRTSALATLDGGSSLHAAVGVGQADLALVWNGALASYRRLELGTGDAPLMLGTEVRRAMEFLWREHGEAMTIDVLHLAAGPGVDETFVERLRTVTSMTVRLVEPPGTPPGMEGAWYAAAVGLALRDTTGLGKVVPKIDLYAGQRSAAQFEEKRRNVWGSVAIAGLAAALGGVGWYMFGQAALASETEAAVARERAAALRTQADAIVAGRRRQIEQYDALRGEGLPVDAILDTVASALPSGVGVRKITVASTGKVTIDGESRSEAMMLGTVQTLQDSPLMPQVGMISFERDRNSSGGFVFQAEGVTLRSDKVVYPHEKGLR